MKISTKFITVIFISLLSASMVFAQGGRGGQRGNQLSETRVLGRKDVEKDLGLTEDQITKIAEYVAKNQPVRGAGGGAGAGGNGGGGQRGGGAGAGGAALTAEQIAAFAKAAAERREKTRKDLLEIISEAQLKRVDEIILQLRGNEAITSADIQKSLGLSEDQIAKVKDLQAKQREANMGLGQKVQSQEITRDEAATARARNTETLKTELGKILTSAQADKLKTMQGKAFTPDPPPTI